MADKLNSEGEAQQGQQVSGTQFVAHVGQLIQATVKKDQAVGRMRQVRAMLEKEGANMRALDFCLRLRKLEGDAGALMLRDIIRYGKWLKLDALSQGELFGTLSDDAAAPNERVQGELLCAVAGEEGFKAGKAGRDRHDHRWEPGSPAAAAFDEGWVAGQGAIVGVKVKRTAGGNKGKRVASGRRGKRSNPEDRAEA
jgi:hypothetical protein